MDPKGPDRDGPGRQAELALREREVLVLEREQDTREARLELERSAAERSGWRSPVVVAILAAAVAATGNAGIAVLNGHNQRVLDVQRAEDARILEMIKTGTPDAAAENLKFLLGAGLISDPDRRSLLADFLETRLPGAGPALPAERGEIPGSITGGIIGVDDAVPAASLVADSVFRRASNAVGELRVDGLGRCTAFLVDRDLAITAAFCVPDAVQDAQARTATLVIGHSAYAVNLPPEELVDDGDISYAVLRVQDRPGDTHGALALSSAAPVRDETLAMILFRAGREQLFVSSTDCRVLSRDASAFEHRCDSGPGSSGAPLLSSDGTRVVGIHLRRGGSLGNVATRADQVLSRSNLLRSSQ